MTYVPNRPRGFADAEPQNKGHENMENPEIKSIDRSSHVSRCSLSVGIRLQHPPR